MTRAVNTEATAVAYSRAIGAARAALDVDVAVAAPAARDALAEVTDPEELRRVAGALAFVATVVVPRAVRRGKTVREALETCELRTLWETS